MQTVMRRSHAPAVPPAVPAVQPTTTAAATSTASSSTQHSTSSLNRHSKRIADPSLLDGGLQTPKRRRPAAATLATDELAAVNAAAASSCSSSSSITDGVDDTAASYGTVPGTAAPPAAAAAQLLSLAEAEHLYVAVVTRQHSLKHVLQLLLQRTGEQGFVAFLTFVLKQQQQQRRRQHLGYQLLDALSTDDHALFTRLLQILSHPDPVTCYDACVAFQGLAESVGPDQVLTALLAKPQNVLLLLSALDENRLRDAYHQGYVITVTYSGKVVTEPLCSGTVGCMIKSASKLNLKRLVTQLVTVLTSDSELAVSAAMALVIVARNAAAGVDVLLPHSKLLLAAAQQWQWRVAKRVMMTLRVMAESTTAAAASARTAALAAGPCGDMPAAAAACCISTLTAAQSLAHAGPYQQQQQQQ